MKKFGMAIGIILICVAFTFFFLVGINTSGIWPYIVGVIFLIVGLAIVILSDKLNNGKEKRENEKQIRDEHLKRQKNDLQEHLAREKVTRDEMLGNIKENIYKKQK